MLDFGPSALVPLRKILPNFNRIDQILISHLHGDHFGGVPFLLLDAEFVSRRKRPLTVVGPEGVRKRLEDLITILFPNLLPTTWRFPLSFVELSPNSEQLLNTIKVKAYKADHPDPSPTLAFRLEFGDKVLAFSGDTAWTESLIDVSAGADLFLCECHTFEPNDIYHLDWQTLKAKQFLLRARRILLTHMSQPMLDRITSLDSDRFEFATDDIEINF